jgi:hypothetical protein
LHAVAPVTFARSAAQVVDQQQTEKRSCTFDEAIVIAPIGVSIDEIFELGREPSNPRRSRSGQWRPLRIHKIARGRHEAAADVLQSIEPIRPHQLPGGDVNMTRVARLDRRANELIDE